MVLNVSTRTDIVAFYTPWLLNRFKEGFVDVRNPFQYHQVSRILLNPDTIDAIVFCTKNPLPIMPYLSVFKEYPLLFQITITPYRKEIEAYVPDKKVLINKIKELSNILGRNHIFIRYDPILLNDTYTIQYHLHCFEMLLQQLSSYVERVIISFIDLKKNTIKHQTSLKLQPFQEEDIYFLGQQMGKLAKKYGVDIQSCAEKYDFSAYGFLQEGCISGTTIFKLTGKSRGLKLGKNREYCHCIETVDIGCYNTCKHYCQYCYANYKEDLVEKNYQFHDMTSSLLIGHLDSQDKLKIRK